MRVRVIMRVDDVKRSKGGVYSAVLVTIPQWKGSHTRKGIIPGGFWRGELPIIDEYYVGEMDIDAPTIIDSGLTIIGKTDATIVTADTVLEGVQLPGIGNFIEHEATMLNMALAHYEALGPKNPTDILYRLHNLQEALDEIKRRIGEEHERR